jgi:hypothetical protein
LAFGREFLRGRHLRKAWLPQTRGVKDWKDKPVSLGDQIVTLKAFCAGLGLVGLLASDVIASGSDDSAGDANAADEGTLELFISCESKYPLASVKWGDDDNTKSAETASIFLDVPSVTRQTIIDKAAECFSALKREQAMIEINFDHLILRCGIGPDVKRGHIVLGYVD